jgi:hypothetical protein
MHSTSSAACDHMSTARPISMLYSSVLYLCMKPKRCAAGICARQVLEKDGDKVGSRKMQDGKCKMVPRLRRFA